MQRHLSEDDSSSGDEDLTVRGGNKNGPLAAQLLAPAGAALGVPATANASANGEVAAASSPADAPEATSAAAPAAENGDEATASSGTAAPAANGDAAPAADAADAAPAANGGGTLAAPMKTSSAGAKSMSSQGSFAVRTCPDSGDEGSVKAASAAAMLIMTSSSKRER